MTIFEAMSKRKSIRQFKNEALQPNVLQEIQNYMQTVQPLLPNIKTEFNIVGAGKAKGLFSIEAPHYLAFYSENKAGHLMNAGFILQQLDLHLVTMGLGSCWLGVAKPTQKHDTELEFIIVKAFGEPAATHTRGADGFNRKATTDITNGEDSRFVYTRLAPSGYNGQPWFFVKEQGSIAVYRKQLGAIKEKLLGNMNQIDIGIALCHFALTSQAEGIPFNFDLSHAPQNAPPARYIYMGSIVE